MIFYFLKKVTVSALVPYSRGSYYKVINFFLKLFSSYRIFPWKLQTLHKEKVTISCFIFKNVRNVCQSVNENQNPASPPSQQLFFLRLLHGNFFIITFVCNHIKFSSLQNWSHLTVISVALVSWAVRNEAQLWSKKSFFLRIAFLAQ